MKYIFGVYSQLSQYASEKQKECLLNEELKPLFTMLYQNSHCKIMLRLGISYFEWLEKKHPEINMLINDLCMKNQIEIVASSFYDAMISFVPTAERSLHLEKSITYLRKRFRKKIRGIWFNNQEFNPSSITAMEQCGAEYTLLSSFCQTQNNVLFNKPFFMSEMGKEAIVFPFDDRYSKIISDYSQNPDNPSKFISDILKTAENSSSGLNTIMLNLDQMVMIDGSAQVFEKIFNTLGSNCTTCSEYIDNHEILKEYYYPLGLYGRDLYLGKANSVKQFILDIPVLNRYSRLSSTLRDSLKDIKKNSDTRKKVEQAIFKSSDCSLVANDNYNNHELRISSSKYLCEAEAEIASIGLLPGKIDIDGDRIPEFTVIQKGSVAYLNTKGGVISRLNIIPCLVDICFNNGDGLFQDSFRNTINGKVTALSTKRYDVTPLDNKGLEYFAKCPLVEINKTQITVSKHYKFRQNAVIAEVEIENLSNSALKDYSYECNFDFSFTNCSSLPELKSDSAIEEGKTKSVTAKGCFKPYSASVYFSEPVYTSSRIMENKVENSKDLQYQYTQLKIQKKLNLNPSEVEHLTITLKLEKTR